MSNRLVDHVWVCDTAGTAAVTNETVYVDGVRWVGSTTDADQAVIKNVVNDDIVWEAKLDESNNNAGMTHDSHVKFRCLNGFKVTTLSNGTLYIYGKLE